MYNINIIYIYHICTNMYVYCILKCDSYFFATVHQGLHDTLVWYITTAAICSPGKFAVATGEDHAQHHEDLQRPCSLELQRCV